MISIADAASAYILAAERCEEQRPIQGDQILFLLVPAVTNRAFAAELYIKAISQRDGQMLRGHDLNKLFHGLAVERRNAIVQETRMQEVSFNSALEENANLFVEWRYLFEKNNIQVSWQFLQKLSLAVKAVFECVDA